MDTMDRILMLNQGLVDIGRKRRKSMDYMGNMTLEEVDSITFSIPIEETDLLLKAAFGSLYSEPGSIHFRMIFSTDAEHRLMHMAEMKYFIDTVEIMRTGDSLHVGRRFLFKPYRSIVIGADDSGKPLTLYDALIRSVGIKEIIGGYTSIYAFILSLLDPVTKTSNAMDEDFSDEAKAALLENESIRKE